MHPSRTSRSFALLLLGAALAGCTPTCEQVCDKLVACGDLGTERMSSAECQEQCNDQKLLLSEWTDDQQEAAFEAELSCLFSSECADVAAGVCYDDAVYSF